MSETGAGETSDGTDAASEAGDEGGPTICPELASDGPADSPGPHAITLRLENIASEPVFVEKRFNVSLPQVSVSDEDGSLAPHARFAHETPTCDSLIDGAPDHTCGHLDGWSTVYFKLDPGAHLELPWGDAGWRWYDEDNDICPFTLDEGCYATEPRSCRRWVHGSPGERTFFVRTYGGPLCMDCDCVPVDGVCEIENKLRTFTATADEELTVNLPVDDSAVTFPIGGPLFP